MKEIAPGTTRRKTERRRN